jgi:hypothetical protein
LTFPEVGPVTLCSQKKSSPFRTNFFARLGHGSVDNALLAPLAPCSDAPDAGHRHLATFYSLYVELRLCFIISALSRASNINSAQCLFSKWTAANQDATRQGQRAMIIMEQGGPNFRFYKMLFHELHKAYEAGKKGEELRDEGEE